MVAKQAGLEKSRLIESADRRIVHFIFNPTTTKIQLSPFSNALNKYIELNEEDLAEYEKAQTDAFDAYVENLTKDEPEEGFPNPAQFGPSPHYELGAQELAASGFRCR